MMKFKLGLLMVSVMFLFSCGDDDDDAVESIVGTWRSTVFSQTDCDDPGRNFSNFQCGGCFSNTFKNDGTFTSAITIPAVLDESISGIYTVDGTVLTTCDDDGANCEESTFILTDSDLTIVSEDFGCKLTVSFKKS